MSTGAPLERERSALGDEPSPLERWHALTGFQRDTVKSIAELTTDGSLPYGLGIKEHLTEHYDESVNHGRLYPNLDDLVDRGVVEKTAWDDRTNRYQLTDDGIEMLRAHRENLDETLVGLEVNDGA